MAFHLSAPRLGQTDKRLWRVFAFLVRLLLLSIPLYVVLSLPGILLPLQHIVAGNSAWILGSAGYAVSQQGIMLTISGAEPFAFIISEDCTAWKSMLLFSALVFAVSGVGMRKRVYGILFGLPLIWAGNLVRIWMVVATQQSYGVDTAMFLHNILWQAGLICMVLALWIIWILKFVPNKEGHIGRFF